MMDAAHQPSPTTDAVRLPLRNREMNLSARSELLSDNDIQNYIDSHRQTKRCHQGTTGADKIDIGDGLHRSLLDPCQKNCRAADLDSRSL